MLKNITKYLPLFIVFFSSFIGSAQNTPEYEPPDSRILFVFDASQSMAGYWESGQKINIARNLLIKFIDSLEQIDNIQLALRVYGHQSPVPPQDCSDSKLEVPFGKRNGSKIRQKLRFIRPKGTTPIAYSLELCQEDFPECSDCRNIIVLITDGIEACDGDPCEASYNLQKMGIALKPFVIGIGIDEGFKETFECIGNYYNAQEEDKFEEALEIVITQALNSTTAQVNLLDNNGNPNETNVNMTFYDKFSGKIRHNYIHTINHKGNPDTIVLDPLVTYRMKVHTIPPVEVDSIKVVAGKHTIVAADVPQGYLILKTIGGIRYYRDMDFMVRKSGQLQTLNVQKINTTGKYIIGNYDLEIPILPRLNINNVEIKQSHTTTVEIPRPGIVTILMSSPGYGSIYVERGNDLEWIHNLNTEVTNQTITLQPGKYRVVYRPLHTKQTIFTTTKSFEITSGSSVPIQLK